MACNLIPPGVLAMTCHSTALPALRDMLLATGAAAYFIGFVVALEVALSRLVY
jgi:hypothetical protein